MSVPDVAPSENNSKITHILHYTSKKCGLSYPRGIQSIIVFLDYIKQTFSNYII